MEQTITKQHKNQHDLLDEGDPREIVQATNLIANSIYRNQNVFLKIRGSLDKFPDFFFFCMGTFIDNTHMKF